MSDKTTAALAAEQADAEATTTQEAELLPAATLDELEQVDLGTVAEGERAPFRITDDRCADWAIRKIADERSEYDRLKALADDRSRPSTRKSLPPASAWRTAPRTSRAVWPTSSPPSPTRRPRRRRSTASSLAP